MLCTRSIIGCTSFPSSATAAVGAGNFQTCWSPASANRQGCSVRLRNETVRILKSGRKPLFVRGTGEDSSEGSENMSQLAVPEKPSNEFAQTEGEAYGDDMHDSYGIAYGSRSADEGYGESYNEAVQKYKTKPTGAEGEQHSEDTESPSTETKSPREYDTTQGHPVAEKEHGRHALREHSHHHRGEDVPEPAGAAGGAVAT